MICLCRIIHRRNSVIFWIHLSCKFVLQITFLTYHRTYSLLPCLQSQAVFGVTIVCFVLAAFLTNSTLSYYLNDLFQIEEVTFVDNATGENECETEKEAEKKDKEGDDDDFLSVSPFSNGGNLLFVSRTDYVQLPSCQFESAIVSPPPEPLA